MATVVVVVVVELALLKVVTRFVVCWAVGFEAPLFNDDLSGETDEWSGVERVIVKAVDSSLGLLMKSAMWEKKIYIIFNHGINICLT